jgi:glycine cleavage system H lipoate-binding protein
MKFPFANRSRASSPTASRLPAPAARALAAFAALLAIAPAALAQTIEAAPFINLANHTAYVVTGDCTIDAQTVSVSVGGALASPTCTGARYDSGPIDVSGVPDGPVTVEVDDGSGPISTIVTKDAVAPSVAFDATVPINAANVAAYTVTGTCSEDGRDVTITITDTGTGNFSAPVACGAPTTGTFTATGDLTGFAEGTITIAAVHADAAGNSANANTTAEKDTAAPSVAFDATVPINAANVAAYTVTGTCSEDGRDVTITITDTGAGNFSAPVACGTPTTGTFTATGDLTGFAEGTITIAALHADAAGNSANANTTAEKDTAAPSVAFDATVPINAANVAAYTVTGTCSENGRDVTITVTDTGTGSFSAPVACGTPTVGTFTATGDLTGFAEGTITIAAVHADAAGNSANANTTANKDTAAPSVAINPPAVINAANAAAYTASGTCSEDGRNVVFTISVGGVEAFSAPLPCGTPTAGTFSATGDLSAFPDGTLDFAVTHADAAGNSASANASAAKDTVALAPAITSPAAGAGVAANPAVSGTGETGATVTVREGVATVCTAPVTAGNWTCNTTLAAGSHTLAATQVDAAGNTSPASADLTFTVLAEQSITFDALPPRTFGDAPFEVAATASSGLAVSFSSLTTGVCTVAGNTVTIVAVGGCTIAADQAGDATWLPATQVTQSFSVGQGTQAITFGALSNRTIGAPPFLVTATSSSGLDVSFSSLTTPVCTVSGSLVTMVAVGTCTIAADQAGNANVAAAPQVTQSFQVLCDTGAPGDCDGDGIPNAVETAEGRDPLVKDNDIFSPGAASARLFAMQQYRDFLGREGDEPGIQGWTGLVDGGTYTRTQVIDAFLNSQEFGGFVAPVVRLYFSTFLRVPDYEGLTANAALVRAGTVTLQQLADFFAASPEFAATYGALDDTQFVTLLYTNVLGRAPDQAGLDGWVALLQGGMSRGQVLLGFSDSAEYQAAIANEVFVSMMYTAMLRRTPEAAGFSGWVQFLDDATYTRDQVINGFFLSTEYRARFLP